MKKFLSLFFILSGLTLAQSFIELNENFNNGLGLWSISSQGNNCAWENYFPPYPGPYTIPDAEAGIMAADIGQCGNPVNTTAVLDTIIDMSGYFCILILYWDSDWNAAGNSDSAFVEISFDYGNTWQAVWTKAGESSRNTFENAIYDEYLQGDEDYAMIRFRTAQNGAGSWWAIDNLSVNISFVLEIPARPTNLTAELAGTGPDIQLHWNFNQSSSGELGFQITRKTGDPWPYNNYQILDSVDISARSYTDTTTQDNLEYSYRIRSYSFELYSFLSDPAIITTPVEFVSFTAAVNENNVILNWIIATEINNAGFEVQSNSGNGWKVLAFIPGAGNSTLQHTYSYSDRNLSRADYKYRLKQIDYNGSYQYSEIVSAEIKGLNEYFLYQNYPNPFNPSTTISYYIPQSGKVCINVYNLLAQQIAVPVNEIQEAGRHDIVFNAYKLPAGLYFYQVQSGSFSETRKMLLLK